MIDFPSSPASGQVVTSPSGVQWRWDGTAWLLTAQGGGAKGAVAYAQIVANQGGITSGDIAGLTATWTADPTRTYRTTVYIEAISTVLNDICSLFIVDAGGAGKARAGIHVSSLTAYQAVTAQVVETGLSGSTTRKANLFRTGTGTLAVDAAPTRPNFIMVEDITYEAGSGGASPGAKGCIASVAAGNVAITTTTYTRANFANVLVEAGRVYAIQTKAMGTYITGGASGSTFSIALHVDGVAWLNTLIVDTVLAGGYIPQPEFTFRYKSPTTRTALLEIAIKRDAAGSGTMQARFDMAVIDEGANI